MSNPCPFATHLPVLLACLRRTDGPILELGAGFYSTPLVRAFAAEGEFAAGGTPRYGRTVETRGDWGRRVAAFLAAPPPHAGHDFVLVAPGDLPPIEDRLWSVALVDHEQKMRVRDLLRLRTRADLIVCHDTEAAGYNWEPHLSTFRFRYDYRRLVPHTSVVSDFVELDWLDGALGDLW